MNDEKIDLSELKEILSSCAPEDGDMKNIDFTECKKVETPLFSLLVPVDFQYVENQNGFDIMCFQGDMELTPMQITVKSEPLILVSPQEHYEKLKTSILNTKGMVMKTAKIAGINSPRFDLPTLGGKQMFFPLYHTTEVFSLRFNFVGKIANAESVAEKILASFSFKEFKPRVPQGMIDSICKVFEMNRANFANDFAKSKPALSSADEAMELCQSYGGALYGCIRVLDEEVNKIKNYDISPSAMEELQTMGNDFCRDMEFKLDYKGETFSLPLFTAAKAMIDNWQVQ
ncbi:MAG: hypothetical protein RSH79_03205 [Clostridiales bacterium]